MAAAGQALARAAQGAEARVSFGKKRCLSIFAVRSIARHMQVKSSKDSSFLILRFSSIPYSDACLRSALFGRLAPIMGMMECSVGKAAAAMTLKPFPSSSVFNSRRASSYSLHPYVAAIAAVYCFLRYSAGIQEKCGDTPVVDRDPKDGEIIGTEFQRWFFCLIYGKIKGYGLGIYVARCLHHDLPRCSVGLK